jgi:2-iminobutanoate/2-iminopropanoate deaminase
VITRGYLLETVLTGIPDDADRPVDGGVGAETREMFKQLDEVLSAAGLTRTAVTSARLYLQHVNRDIAEVNAVWKEYFGMHAPVRCAYGVELQSNMLIEATFFAEAPRATIETPELE